MSDPFSKDPYGNGSGGQDPYGNQQPGNQNPYGPPSGSFGGNYGTPPGGGNYGGGGYTGGPGGGSVGTDGVSIAALVTSFLCCFAPVGVILGFVGLKRTKNGQRKGRGMAIAGIVIGIIMTLITVGLGAVFFIFADKVVTPGNAEVGQCVNVDEDDGTVFLYKKDCNEEHDAEIVGIAKVTDENQDEIDSAMAGYCAEAIEPDDLAKLTEYIGDIEAVIEDPKKVDVGDHLVCYVNPGDKLDEPLL